MATDYNTSGKKKRSSKTSQTMNSIIVGRSFLSLDFFRRNKFECQSKMQEVMTLKTELDNAKTDCVNASAKYNSMIRESQMKAYVDTMHIDLSNPERPPYYLSKK